MEIRRREEEESRIYFENGEPMQSSLYIYQVIIDGGMSEAIRLGIDEAIEAGIEVWLNTTSAMLISNKGDKQRGRQQHVLSFVIEGSQQEELMEIFKRMLEREKEGETENGK